MNSSLNFRASSSSATRVPIDRELSPPGPPIGDPLQGSSSSLRIHSCSTKTQQIRLRWHLVREQSVSPFRDPDNARSPSFSRQFDIWLDRNGVHWVSHPTKVPHAIDALGGRSAGQAIARYFNPFTCRLLNRMHLETCPLDGTLNAFKMCRSICMIIVCSVVIAGRCSADEPDKTSSQLVLLRNGEVLQGHLTRDDDHYLVHRGGSATLRIPYKDISHVGSSMANLYEHKANRIVEFRAEEHLGLAAWCLENHLESYATHHILRAETINPLHPHLPLMKARLERYLQTGRDLDTVDDETSLMTEIGREKIVPPSATGRAASERMTTRQTEPTRSDAPTAHNVAATTKANRLPARQTESHRTDGDTQIHAQPIAKSASPTSIAESQPLSSIDAADTLPSAYKTVADGHRQLQSAPDGEPTPRANTTTRYSQATHTQPYDGNATTQTRLTAQFPAADPSLAAPQLIAEPNPTTIEPPQLMSPRLLASQPIPEFIPPKVNTALVQGIENKLAKIVLTAPDPVAERQPNSSVRTPEHVTAPTDGNPTKAAIASRAAELRNTQVPPPSQIEPSEESGKEESGKRVDRPQPRRNVESVAAQQTGEPPSTASPSADSIATTNDRPHDPSSRRVKKRPHLRRLTPNELSQIDSNTTTAKRNSDTQTTTSAETTAHRENAGKAERTGAAKSTPAVASTEPTVAPLDGYPADDPSVLSRPTTKQSSTQPPPNAHALSKEPTTPASGLQDRLEKIAALEVDTPPVASTEDVSVDGISDDDLAQEVASDPTPAEAVPDVEIPPALLKAYVTSIQPLLLTRCASAACHGSDTASEFQLHQLADPHRPSRATTMKNLASVIGQMSDEDAVNSPLVTWGQSPHGESSSKLLAISDAQQQKRLLHWLHDVSNARHAPTEEVAEGDPSRPTREEIVAKRHESLSNVSTRISMRQRRDAGIRWQDKGQESNPVPTEPRLQNVRQVQFETEPIVP